MIFDGEFSYKTILITGGTGTFAHAILRRLLASDEDIVIRLLSRDEYKQHLMLTEFSDPRVRFFLGDVRDLSRLHTACAGVDLVIHAAALKRIERGEYDGEDFLKTNVLGTMNVIHACHTMGVRQALFLGTDKSCQPINLYGATKMLAERLWIQSNGYAPHGTRLGVCRYANVMGSRGSVLEVWGDAMAQGRSLTLTDARMSRFWLSPAEAVDLVLWAATHGLRGGIAVPHLPAFLLTDLARAMLPDSCTWHITGRRPGEKLAEDLMTDDELSSAYWYGPSDVTPVHYIIPPAIQHWETPAIGTGWRQPPVPCLTGDVVDSPGPVVAYNSATWPWRLTVQDLRAKLNTLGDAAHADR